MGRKRAPFLSVDTEMGGGGCVLSCGPHVTRMQNQPECESQHALDGDAEG